MKTTTAVTLEGVVDGIPKFMGRFYRGPTFFIPFRVTGIEPSNAHKTYKALLGERVELHYREHALPIFKKSRLKAYCNGYGLPETRSPNRVVDPAKIEVIDKKGNVIAEYS